MKTFAKTALGLLALLILIELSECAIRQHRPRVLKRYSGAMVNKNNNKEYSGPDHTSFDASMASNLSGDYLSRSGSTNKVGSRSGSQKPSAPKGGTNNLHVMESQKPKFMNSRRSQTKGSMRRSERLEKTEQYQDKSEEYNMETSADEPEHPGNNGRTAGGVDAETKNYAPVDSTYNGYQSSNVAKVKADSFILEFVLSKETDEPSTENYEDAFGTTVNFLRFFLHMIYDDAFVSVEGKRVPAKSTNGRPRIGVAPTVGFLHGSIDMNGQDVAALVRDAFTDPSTQQYFLEQLRALEEPNIFRYTVEVIYLASNDIETVAAVQIPSAGIAGPLVGVAVALCIAVAIKTKNKWRELNLVQNISDLMHPHSDLNNQLSALDEGEEPATEETVVGIQ